MYVRTHELFGGPRCYHTQKRTQAAGRVCVIIERMNGPTDTQRTVEGLK